MTGEGIYAAFSRNMLRYGTVLPRWEELPEKDRLAYHGTASDLNEAARKAEERS